ncbi:hypothetical protein [Streptomyces sp. NPDC056549]|uniref:hypothetical protein n=1 Tax=Streptomyces sp. NPDC056549 TaxID=3345864 RepID=UPI0036B73C79
MKASSEIEPTLPEAEQGKSVLEAATGWNPPSARRTHAQGGPRSRMQAEKRRRRRKQARTDTVPPYSAGPLSYRMGVGSSASAAAAGIVTLTPPAGQLRNGPVPSSTVDTGTAASLKARRQTWPISCAVSDCWNASGAR